MTDAREIIAKVVDDAIDQCRSLHDYAGRPAWEEAIAKSIAKNLSCFRMLNEDEIDESTVEKCAEVVDYYNDRNHPTPSSALRALKEKQA